MPNYLFSFMAATGSAVVLTPVSMKVARMVGAVDRPNARKIHANPTPRVGGLAIFGGLAVVAVPALIGTGGDAASGFKPLCIALIAASVVFVIGLVDDLVNSHRAHLKLLALSIATVAVLAGGFDLESVSFGGDRIVSLGALSWPVSFIWVVGITTAINFIDGLDGLAAGITAVAAGAIALVAAVGGDPITATIALALAGSLCGFLVFNTNPAKVFMGDCGSLFCGFAVATLSLICARRTHMTAGFTLPALALGIPILDTSLTMVRRAVLQRRSVFAAERGHVHHRLIDLGFGHRNAVMVLYAVTLAAAGAGAGAVFSHSPARSAAFAAIHPVGLLVFFGLVGSLRVGDIVAAVRRNREFARLAGRYSHTVDEMQLRFEAAVGFDAWWEQVRESLRRLDFVRFSMPLINRDGTDRTLVWDGDVGHPAETMHARIPIRQRRAGTAIRADAEVAAADSLELAGRRVAAFTRLMHDNGLDGIVERQQGARAKRSVWTLDRFLPGRAKSKPRRVDFLARSSDVAPESDGIAVNAAASLDRLPPVGTVTEVVTTFADRLAGTVGPDSVIPAGTRVAVVHDFLYTYAGAERVLEQILKVFPDAEVFSLFDFLPPEKRDFLQGRPVTTSFIHRMPFARKRHRHYLALMPVAIEQLDVSAYDLVVSSSYLAAKGVLTRPGQLHVCYCHSPARFAWDLQHQYLDETGLRYGIKSLLARVVLHYLRTWDARTANGVDKFLTNSDYIGRRIEKCYRRSSTTVYPPVDVEGFALQVEKEDYYLTASRLVPYKRIDMIAEAFSAMPDKRLIIIGEGPDLDKIHAKAGPNVKMVGHQPADRLVDYMRNAKAFVFAAEEDFGIVPVEAQACGTPVIGFGRGGVTETVVDGVTGVLFDQQTAACLREAVLRFEGLSDTLDPRVIRSHAERFNAARFRDEFLRAVEQEWAASRPSRDNFSADVSNNPDPSGREVYSTTSAEVAE